ncbi:hypothetical protein PSTT_10334, partial [Puccinia striiformis]
RPAEISVPKELLAVAVYYASYTNCHWSLAKNQCQRCSRITRSGNLSDEAATALSADVEFRLTQLIECQVHATFQETNLLVEDVDYALRAKNIEPLWGFASTDTLSFRRTTSAVGNLYFVDEEEIDLTKVLAADLPPVPQETSYTGIQILFQ